MIDETASEEDDVRRTAPPPEAWCRYRYVPSPSAPVDPRRRRSIELAGAWFVRREIELRRHVRWDGVDLRLVWLGRQTCEALRELFSSGAIPTELVLVDVRDDDPQRAEIVRLVEAYGVYLESM